MQRRPALVALPCSVLLLSHLAFALHAPQNPHANLPAHIETKAARRCTGLGLRLRGGSDGTGFDQPSGYGAGGYGQPPPAPYGQPPAPAPSSIPQYTSPAAAPVDWGTAPQAPPPAPASGLAPPPAPRAPPKAPAPAAMPAAPPPLPPKAPAPAAIPPAPAPSGGEVAWDQSSASPVRRFIDLFGWDNVSPFVWFFLSAFLAWANALFRREADDDIEMLPGARK